MMLNYLKSEWYRTTHSKTIYMFTAIVAAITLAANLILVTVGSGVENFSYANVSFSLSNLIAMMPLLFWLSGLLVALLYADDQKNGTLGNAIAEGLPRWQLFIAKCLICVLLGTLSMIIILAVYIGSAVLLLEGPSASITLMLISGVAAALPSVIAVVVLAVACFHFSKTTMMAIISWVLVVFIVPALLQGLGYLFEPLALIASWLPTNFLQNEVSFSQSGIEALWQTPFGLMKCLVAGTGFLLLFSALGIWRTEKMEF